MEFKTALPVVRGGLELISLVCAQVRKVDTGQRELRAGRRTGASVQRLTRLTGPCLHPTVPCLHPTLPGTEPGAESHRHAEEVAQREGENANSVT